MNGAVDASGLTESNELCKVLEQALNRRFSTHRSIIRFEHRPSGYQSSFVVEEIDVWLNDGTNLQIFFKDLSWQSLSEDIRAVKPAFLYNPLTEIEVYRTILRPELLGTPAYYGSAVDPQQDRYWLFMERVPGLKLRHIGSFEIWQQVARYLARMHAHFAAELQTSQHHHSHLPRYNAEYYRLWMRRAHVHLGGSDASFDGSVSRDIEWLSSRYDQVVQYLEALPTVLIHGEFYAGNIILQETGDESRASGRICPIDWETAAIGPGLIDLAALIGGSWTETQKTELALAYYDEMMPVAGWFPSWFPSREAFLRALDYHRLHQAVQWLGWSTNWSPPSEEEHDWLSEALQMAQKIEL